MSGAALLALSVLYIGGFEHWRLHAPIYNSVTPKTGGLRAALIDAPAAQTRALAEGLLAGGVRRALQRRS